MCVHEASHLGIAAAGDYGHRHTGLPQVLQKSQYTVENRVAHVCFAACEELFHRLVQGFRVVLRKNRRQGSAFDFQGEILHSRGILTVDIFPDCGIYRLGVNQNAIEVE